MSSFRDLLVWQKAMALVTDIYCLTRNFPKEELYGLTSQIRRAMVSVPSNIAEGYGRNSTSDYVRFLRISIGSLYELQTQMEIAFNLQYCNSEVFTVLLAQSNEISRMLTAMVTKIENGR
ncbi:TPA: four helix bundle protein [Candidatus Sumerlaeota bacterium]|nr:four helix bundle protein [Candidatus Sumerlaeota bacterium]